MNIELLKQFHFLRIEWFLLIIPFFLLLYYKYKSNLKSENNKSFPKHLSNVLNVDNNELRKQLPLLFLSFIAILGILVSAGFSWSRVSSPFGEDNLPLVILLDNSESMEQQDLAPSRIERSKHKIMDLLEQRNGGKSQLITYAGSSHTVMPMTEDIKVFKTFLESINYKIMPVKGKAPETSFQLIDEIYEKENKPLSILLITDGLGTNSLSMFNEYFSKNNHQLIVWGAGNPLNKSLISFEENKLIKLSNDNNGEYIRITPDNSDVNYILSKMNNHFQLSADNSQPWNDQSYYLVFLIAFLFLFWFRKGWLVQWSFVLLLSSTLIYPNDVYANETIDETNIESDFSLKQEFINLWLTKDQQGRIFYQEESYKKAADSFEDPYWKAMSYYKSFQYKESYIYFLRVGNLESKILAANSLARNRDYLAARNFYDELIKEYPENDLLLHNRNVINDVMEKIQMFSEGQANTENETSRELGEDEPQTTEGVEEQVIKEQLISEELKAEDILQDESLNEKWMERVQANPSLFLKNKFRMQKEKGEKQ